MAAALLREVRIRNVLPIAVAQGWPVRRLAREARIGWGAAGEALRTVQQRSATGVDGETASLCGAAAAGIRESVGRAAASLVKRVEVAAADLERGLDPSGIERLSRAMEAALRIADNLDGLAHLRRLEEALVRRLDGEQVAAAFAPQGSDPFRDAEALSVESVCAVAVAGWPRVL